MVIQGRTKMLMSYALPSGSNTPLNDTTMPSDDSSTETNPKVHVPSLLTSKTATLNPQVGDQGKRYL